MRTGRAWGTGRPTGTAKMPLGDPWPVEPREANDPCTSPETACQAQETGAGRNAAPKPHPGHVRKQGPLPNPYNHQAALKSVFAASSHFVVTHETEASSDCRKRGVQGQHVDKAPFLSVT